MFKKKLPLLFMTLMIGLSYGCGSSNPYVDSAESNIEDQNFKAALQAAEESIQNQPQDPLGYYYKGVALGGIAETTEKPSERREYYAEMNKAFAQAKEVASGAEEAPGEIERIDVVKNTLWRNEHNKAIEYAADDSVKKTVEEPLQVAVNHLQNATTIIPDSVLSWDVLAQVYYMNNDIEGAIKAMDVVVEKKESPSAEDYLRLAGYYRVANKPEEALKILETAREAYPEHVQIVQSLADAYTNTGKIDKSIAIVEELIEQDPQNPQYHLVLGTQIYQTVLQLNENLKENYDQLFELGQELQDAGDAEAQQIRQQIDELEGENEEIQSRINSLTEKATKEIETVLEYRPDDDVAYNTLGVIYQNKAAALFEERNRTLDNQKSAKLDAQAKKVLRQALKYYEKAAEINPDNQEYWKSLFSIYTTLGMDQKAEEAMKKAGM